MTVEIARISKTDQAWLASLNSQVNLTDDDEATLRQCLRISAVSWIGSVDGKAACVWGLVPPTLMSDQAYVWLFTSEIVEAHQFLLVRYSQMMVEDMLKEFGTLVGHCKIGAFRSMRWLRWLGAVFGKPTGKGIPFMIRRKDG